MDKKSKVIEIIKVFKNLYPEAGCTLEFEDPIQLLIAAQLSAQCTDSRVNTITPVLFDKYRNVYDFAKANIKELENIIRPVGFFRNKSRNITGCCRMIVEKYGGDLPSEREKLLKLPGVGRKTANLVLGDIYGIPAIVVDTHCKRLAGRIGLTDSENPKKIEFDLMEITPKQEWSRFCHQMVLHGRAICNARKPGCSECEIIDFCDTGKELI